MIAVKDTECIADICEYCGEKIKSIYMFSIIDENGEMEWHYGHKYCLDSLRRKLKEEKC